MMQHQQMVGTQPQVMFDFVQSEIQAVNYLVSPGYTVYLLDSANKVLYEKTYNTMSAYDMTQRVLNQNNSVGSSLTREEVSQMINDALRQYNPHIPKKERINGQSE